MNHWLPLCVLLGLWCETARAQDIRIDGLADVRAVHPSDQLSFLQGGLGKLRWGDGTPESVRPELGGLYLRGVIGITPDLVVVADVRSDTQQKTAFDMLDAYVRWRPVSITRWRWAVRGGAFFVPVSLENSGIGWTSEWTLTPSAINSWVGDELRTLGGEGTLEWRGDVDHVEAVVSVFAWNQPAGVAIADRGWTFDDHPTGLFNSVRLPDLTARQLTPPGQPAGALYSNEFLQVDHSPGWYAGVAWERPDLGRIALLRYDNEANPAAHTSEFAWRTKFWSLGVSTELAGIVLLAQGMLGSTAIAPAPGFVSTTDFYGAYVLAGYEQGEWRYALRLDGFGTDQHQPGTSLRSHERGAAVTAAVTWSARKWLRITAEVLTADYWRNQLSLVNKPPREIETMAQLALRLAF